MAQNILGHNRTFPIYNADGTTFHNLTLKRAVVSSVVMSLGDNISGDVIYPDNSLVVTMQEYIVYNDVKYILVNPPTVVREGMVSDNGDLHGATKYSFVFYHPMCILSNLPFSDVAVTNDQTKYLSQNKSFAWMGTPQDFIDKLNKNLEYTEWVVAKSERFPSDKDDQLSDVLTFDNNTIADALKTGYDTWNIAYVISQIDESDARYAQGKRFLIEYGLPSNEIYESDEKRLSNEPYVFRFGKGVGLKNNSRTPRNNKIITRIAGYGSEDNIPYGYPQIRWYGNQNWDFTIGNSQDSPNSYPIYTGVVGGEIVRLIKHPFTREHLMPSIYAQTIFNKVSPYLSDGTANPNYDPNLEIKDYYDAIDGSVFPNVVNPLAPLYEIHEFSDIKPELGSQSIVTAFPVDKTTAVADKWIDDVDDDGNYIQGYFAVVLPVLSFDIYACAAITQEMRISMRSGDCIGSTFNVQVDWDDYRANFYDVDGNFDPIIGNGHPRNANKYPDSRQGRVTLILQKETETFGTLMPNIYQKPKSGDNFVVLGISMPSSYVEDAEERLDAEMMSYMLETNVYYYEYPLKFDEHFLATHPYILSQLKPNSIVRFMYGAQELELYVKEFTIKYENRPLPTYDIMLTDNIEVVLNQIGQVSEEVEHLGSLIAVLRQSYNRNVWLELAKKLSKVDDDVARGLITFIKGVNLRADTTNGNIALNFDNSLEKGTSGSGVWRDENHNWHAQFDFLRVNKQLSAVEVEIEKMSHIGGALVLSATRCTLSRVEIDEENNLAVCYFNAIDEDGVAITNDWKVGDQARVQTFNIINRQTGELSNHYWWRKVEQVGITQDRSEHYIVFDIEDTQAKQGDTFDVGSDLPMVGDDVVLCGSRAKLTGSDDYDLSRQNVIILDAAGEGSPFIRIYKGVGGGQYPFNLGTARIDLNADDPKLDVSSLTITANGASKDVGEIIDDSFLVWYVVGDAPCDQSGEILATITLGFTGFPDTVNGWTANDYAAHVGDIALTEDGVCYRFEYDELTSTYLWVRKSDDFLIQALETSNANRQTLQNMASDDVITKQEKVQLNTLRVQINAEKQQIVSEANTFNVSSTVVSVVAYTSAYNALKAFLDYFLDRASSDTPLIDDNGYTLYATATIGQDGVRTYSVSYVNLSTYSYAGKVYSTAISDYYAQYTLLRKSITAGMRNEIRAASSSGYDAEINAYVGQLINLLPITSETSGTFTLTELNSLYNAISSWEWDYTTNPSVPTINGAGLLTTSNFAALWSQAYESGALMASAIIQAFTQSGGLDEDGNRLWISGVGISADYFICNTQNFKVDIDGNVEVTGDVSAKNFVNKFVTLPALYYYDSRADLYIPTHQIDLYELLTDFYYYLDGGQYKKFEVGSNRNFVLGDDITGVVMTHTEEMLAICPNGTRVLFINNSVISTHTGSGHSGLVSSNVVQFINSDGITPRWFLGVSKELEPHGTLDFVALGAFTPVYQAFVGSGLVEFVSIPDEDDKCDWVLTRMSAAYYKYDSNIPI